ncbi:MAG: DUF1565 domain-containing protein [Culturomica sp.]|jgi:hypothetical protein|nr:DUF1565 domain-containing protein [Culturomica sp.]
MVQKNLRIWLWGPLLAVLLGVGYPGLAQVYYVSVNGDDGNNGQSKEMPFKTLHKALAQPGVTEVLVAVGVYPVSGKMGMQGELVVPAGVTVRGGYLIVDGTMTDSQADHPEIELNQTILQGDFSCRIAIVRGVLEKVTVMGGRTNGKNGGGVYVESGGTIRNCIVHHNLATGGKVKVGDLCMENSEGFYFLSMSNFKIELKEELVGVVFWVNPNDNVPEGEKGKIIAFATTSILKFASQSPNSIPFTTPSALYYSNTQDALHDLDGERNTDELLALGAANFPLTNFCREYRRTKSDGGRWYMPACGEIVQMYSEWISINNTFEMVWNKMEAADRVSYFNVMTAEAPKPWTSVSKWHGSKLYSSTLFSNIGAWVFQGARVVGVLFKEETGQPLSTVNVLTYPIRKF